MSRSHNDPNGSTALCPIFTRILAVPLFRVVGDDHEQDAAPGHHYRLDALRDFEADVVGFLPLTVGARDYLCVITPQSI